MNQRKYVQAKKRSGRKLLFQIPSVQDELISPFDDLKKPDIRMSDDLAAIQSSLSTKISNYSGLNACGSETRNHRSTFSHFQTTQECQSTGNKSAYYGSLEAKRQYVPIGKRESSRIHHQF